jgi:molecular chaperone GrpE
MTRKKRHASADEGTGGQAPHAPADRATAADPPAGAVDLSREGAVEVGSEPGESGQVHGGSTELVEPPVEATRRLSAALEELKDRHLRLAAEFDNYRKRMQRERNDTWARAQSQLAGRVVEGLDDLSRVAELGPKAAAVADVLDGVRMVERKLMQELEAAGLRRVGVAGEPFDPNHHEAVGALPVTEGAEPGTVGTVLQAGYVFGGSLLRPARVLVYLSRDHERDAGASEAAEPTDGGGGA